MDKERSLIGRAAGGDTRAFSELVGIHQSHLRAYIGGFVRDWHERDDLAQETFVRAYLNLASFRGGSSFRTWLFGIGRHVALEHVRRQYRRRAMEADSLEALVTSRHLDSPGAEEAVEGGAGRIRALEQCLEMLPEGSRSLVDRFYTGRTKTESIARGLKVTVNTVRIKLFRIRQSLRDCIDKRLAGEEVRV